MARTRRPSLDVKDLETWAIASLAACALMSAWTFTGVSSLAAHGAPALDGVALQRAEQAFFDQEAEQRDHHDAAIDRLGIHEGAGVEDHVAEPPARAGQHF